MATGVEVKGSRVEHPSSPGSMFRTAEQLWASTDKTGIPVEGTTFFTDALDATDSGTAGRKCYHVGVEKNGVPGVLMHRCLFVGLRVYS
ncbi:MAG TPA: hypothetical protein VMY35_15275 [Phycisphaerae bacterium]|nr:hypothetical protein [Phycisphaerae bacterium]